MESSMFVKCPNLQFRSKSIIAYTSWERTGFGALAKSSSSQYVSSFSNAQLENQSKLKSRERYTGKMSACSKKRLTKAVSLLVQSSPNKKVYNAVTNKYQMHRLSFVTLTLPVHEKSKDAPYVHKNLLQPLLRKLRDKYGMRNYVWKCELQQNGNVHYHITTDLFIPYQSLRAVWNALTRKEGMLKEFSEKYGHDDPNSVDVQSVKKIQDLEAYIVKYVAKSYQNEKTLKAKVWDCSMNLKRAKYFVTQDDHATGKVLEMLIDSDYCTTYTAENFTIFKFKHESYSQFFPKFVRQKYSEHIEAIRDRFSELFAKPKEKPAKKVHIVPDPVMKQNWVQTELPFYRIN